MRSVALGLAMLLGVACGGGGEPGSAPPSPPPSQVTGVITEVAFEGDQVTSFVVDTRTASHDILIDPEHDYGFNLRHLEKHRQTGDPVFVELDSREGDLYALSILDA